MATNKPTVIVLSGEAGAGKDSVARILTSQHDFVVHSLAAPLKRFAADMFGFTDEQLYGPSSARNQHNDRWNLKCSSCGGDGCPKCGGTGAAEISVRSTLQPLGSEYLRDLVHPDALVFRASWDIAEHVKQGRSVVVNDARYQNDRNRLHQWLGAHRVDVRALVKRDDGAAWRMHQSELDRPSDDELEHIINNDEVWPFPSLASKVNEMLKVLRVD